MIAFIDDHRGAHGVEPICKVLPIAPSTYHAHVAKRAIRPSCRPARKRDAALKIEIQRVFEENFGSMACARSGGSCSAKASTVARCTVARLMASLGLQGVIRGKPVRTTISDKAAPCPLDHVNRQFQAPSAEHALGLRLHLRRDLDRLRLRRLRHRRLRPPDRRLAGLTDGACRLRARCAGAGAA